MGRRKLRGLPGIEYELLAIDKLPEHITNSDLETVYQRSQMDTGGLAHKTTIKLKSKVMLTTNIDVEDKLCNGQLGRIDHLKFDTKGNVVAIYLKMEDEVGTKTINSDTFGRQHNLVPVKRIEKEIKIKKNSLSSPSIKRFQFPLMLSWACTVHKVQGKTFPQIVFCFDLFRQLRFNNGQIYVALSRVTSLAGLYLTGTFDKKHIRFDQRATDEYDCMRENHSIKHAENRKIDENSFTFTLLNVRSLPKHAIDIKCDKSIMESDILLFTETQLTAEPDATVIKTLNPFSLSCNNMSADKYSNIAAAFGESVTLLNDFSVASASLYTVSKCSFLESHINIMLLYRKNNLRQEDFLHTIRYLRDQTDIPHIILGDFNVNALNAEENFLSHYLNDYKMIVDSPTHISGSLIDHVYVHRELLEHVTADTLVHCVYFSDHDAVKVRLKKL